MSKTFEQGREEVAKLCKYFADNRHDFFTLGVKEAHVRQSLIDPFFEALGWDMRNAAMTALQYREVIPEDSLEIEGQQKAPDYTFRVGTLAKFYTEAKKCGVNINADPGPAYQLRRYGWSAKVPLSILTDFEELGVYDCSLRPRPTDKASFGRIQYYRSEEYPDRWRELWDIFSREAVWAGAYDRYAASKRKRGTSEVDSEFLKEIEGWRDSLARNIAMRNLYLGYDDLNTAVQRTIDRIIFLRMAEDRGSESYGQLLKLCERPDIYARFVGDLCRKADEKYNSGIFHFKKEEGVTESPDSLTPKLQIDDKIFKPILQSLYFENGSPYHFGVLPVEILGTVYERFLGKVIRLTADHRAKVEEKPEVRKAGGVYYTPAYIVDYIVKNTVGKMIEGKSPAQLAGGKSGQPLRVLDMACGSGSFLLGAYQCLLDHCQKWYLENRPEKHKDAVYFDNRRKFWRLTITEKKRILISHIFGVDIDLQAVEVSKLSLLLKVLEGETDETVGQSRQLFHERALPNLSNNIKCGNSLIGPDYFSGRLIPDPDEMKRVNPFDWNREFPEAMKSGGFDCVIGNPPYGIIFGNEVNSYMAKKCPTYASVPDAYVAFLEAGHNLLQSAGRFGFIIPSAWLGGPSYISIRKYLLNFSIETLIQLPFDVFKDAYIDTMLLTTKKSSPNSEHSVVVYEYPKKEKILSINLKSLTTDQVNQNSWNENEDHKFVLDVGVLKILSKLGKSIQHKFSDTIKIKRGVLFNLELLTSKKTGLESHRYFEGDIYRYLLNWSADRWIEYGSNMKEYPKEFSWFEGSRIFLRRLVNRQQRLMSAWTDQTVITNKNLYVLKPVGFESWQYILGIVNSRLISRLYLAQVSGATKDDFPQVTITDFQKLPFRQIDFEIKSDKAAHDRMIDFVDQMLELNKKLTEAISDSQKEIIKRQIDATDCTIDQLVYKLYGLTEDEIKIVEDGTKN
ncbi:MAG: N-6 DNA methylase [Candidatus Aminicenantes bacterium]|nr:N-6 DNA methylase [Candidatus Aminicenantes bacterium]